MTQGIVRTAKQFCSYCHKSVSLVKSMYFVFFHEIYYLNWILIGHINQCIPCLMCFKVICRNLLYVEDMYYFNEQVDFKISSNLIQAWSGFILWPNITAKTHHIFLLFSLLSTTNQPQQPSQCTRCIKSCIQIILQLKNKDTLISSSWNDLNKDIV